MTKNETLGEVDDEDLERAVRTIRSLIKDHERSADRFHRSADKESELRPAVAELDREFAQEERDAAEALVTVLHAVGVNPKD